MTKERKPMIKGRERLERQIAVLRLIDEGKTLTEVAREIGANVANTSKLLKTLGVKPLVKGLVGRRPMIDVDDAVRRFISGETIGDIAKVYSVSRQAVHDQLKRRGLGRYDGGYSKRIHDECLARQAAAE